MLGRKLAGEAAKPRVGLGDRHLRDFADVVTGDFDRERFGFEPPAVAGIAQGFVLEARHVVADPARVGLAPTPFQIRDDAPNGFDVW